jgi:hypothetical protein
MRQYSVKKTTNVIIVIFVIFVVMKKLDPEVEQAGA